MGTRAKPPKINLKLFVKTPKGRGIAAGLILALLLLVALLITTLAFPESGKQTKQPVDYVARRIPRKPAAVSQAVHPTTPSATTTDAVSATADPSNYRDPFGPLPSENVTGGNSNTGSSNSGGSDGSSGGSPVDVLSLQSLTTTENGIKAAIVLYKGKQYTVKTGDQIDSSPFKVTDIGESNISLLYGNSRLTLQVGDTIVK